MYQHKGYTALIRFDSEEEMLYGHVAGIRDVLHCEGRSVEEVRKSFRETVDFYLETCKKTGKTPEKPYSGRLNLRMPSDMHAKLAATAESQGHSLNEHIVQTLQKALG